jgi:hypothetical protein
VDYAWLLPLIFGTMVAVGVVGFVIVARKRAALDRADRESAARRRAEGDAAQP